MRKPGLSWPLFMLLSIPVALAASVGFWLIVNLLSAEQFSWSQVVIPVPGIVLVTWVSEWQARRRRAHRDAVTSELGSH